MRSAQGEFFVSPTPVPKRRGCTDLVPIGRVCPECEGPLASLTVAQPALFVHGGAGAVLTTVWDMCAGCFWSVMRSVSETNPRRLA